MAIFYTGKRPILEGRNSNDNVHAWKGTVEKYSNYSIFNSSNALDGMPNNDHTPGTGRHPHGLHMSRVFRGLEDKEQPLDDPGEGARPEGYRYRPLEFKGLPASNPFNGDYGHAEDTPIRGQKSYSYSNYKFDGVPADEQLAGSFGHSVRESGGAATFGSFGPNDLTDKRTGDENALEGDFGQTAPEGYDNQYGRNRVLEWQGVESDRAIF